MDTEACNTPQAEFATACRMWHEAHPGRDTQPGPGTLVQWLVSQVALARAQRDIFIEDRTHWCRQHAEVARRLAETEAELAWVNHQLARERQGGVNGIIVF